MGTSLRLESLASGRTLASRYRLDRLLQAGALAVVWLATQHPLWFGVALVVMVVLSVLLLVVLFKFLRAVWRRVSSVFSGSPGVA